MRVRSLGAQVILSFDLEKSVDNSTDQGLYCKGDLKRFSTNALFARPKGLGNSIWLGIGESMSEVYTASVVGAGSGGQLSIRALAASKRFSLVAVCDIDPHRREMLKSEYPGINLYEEYADMLRADPTDVVCVSTWAPTHTEIALAALDGGVKGLLLEKPLADTCESAERAITRIKGSDVPVVVPHGLLSLPHSREILERVHQGEIGELLLVEIRNSGWDIINAGIHWLNFFVMLIGEDSVDHVMAACDTSTRTYRDGMQVETYAVTSAHTSNGVNLVMTTGDSIPVDACSDRFCVYRIFGTDGTIEFWAFDSDYRIVNRANPEGRYIAVPKSPRTHHQIALEQLAEDMDAGHPDYRSLESSYAALELCLAAYESHRKRCLVKLPLREFRSPTLLSEHWEVGVPYSGEGGGRDGRAL